MRAGEAPEELVCVRVVRRIEEALRKRPRLRPGARGGYGGLEPLAELADWD